MAPLGVPQHLHTFGIQHGMASINIWRQEFRKPKKTPALQATTPFPFPQHTCNRSHDYNSDVTLRKSGSKDSHI